MFCPMYVKTEYSLLQSLIRIPNYIAYAKKEQFTALSISDHNLSGGMEFYKACQKEKIKPVIGLEITLEAHKILLYAKDQIGYQQLCKLSTIQSTREVTTDDLEKWNQNVLLVLPYASRTLEVTLNKIYPDIYYGYENIEQRKQLGTKKKFYLQESCALTKKETNYLPYLEAIRKGILKREVETVYDDFYIKTEKELEQQFSSLDDLEDFISQIHLQFPKVTELYLPIYPCEEGYDSFSYLKKLCIQGLRKQFGETVRTAYVERLKYELSVIEKMGFSNYFLIVADYVNYAKTHGILVGPGRGSAAGSLVAYLLSITSIDPLKEGLLFERFLNPERVTMPDIDIDFEFQKREEVVKYLQEKYGTKRVVGIITFGTLASKQVIRDVARVMGIDLKQVDIMTKWMDSKKTLKENLKQESRLEKMIQNDEELKRLYGIAYHLEGLKRHASQHAAGIVIAKKDLDEMIPLSFNQTDLYVTGYTMEYLEELGLLKMDLLALRNLTLIQDILDDLKKEENLSLTFDEIPFQDPKAISIFTNVLTEGIFQFESPGMKNFLRKFKPTNFSEISVALALFRPGPMNNIDEFIDRKRGKKKVTYLHPDLEPILKETQGIIVYQEQIMQIASVMAGYTYGQADVLRRAMSKKKEDVLLKEKEHFIQGSIQRGYTKEVATQVYDLILKFADYGFNKAHSVSYAVISYKMAYLKAHYPKYFMKNLLSMAIGSSEKTREYIYECKLLHLEIITPDICKSTRGYSICEEGIRYPLSGIKNVGISAITTILEEREKKPFQDIYDFLRRCYGKSINRKTLESMIEVGALSSFGYHRKTLLHQLDLLLNYAELTRGMEEELIPVEKPELEIEEEFDIHTLMSLELENYGFYLTNHPVTEYKLKYPKSIAIEEISSYFDQEVEFVCLVDRVREITTKKQDKMAFLSVSDEVAETELVLFPKVYSENHVEKGSVLHVLGKVEKRFDKYQIIPRKIDVLYVV